MCPLAFGTIPGTMIISRTAFQLKFGQAKPAAALWKEIMDTAIGQPEARPMRMLTDLSGPNYVLVTEVNLRGFTDLGPSTHVWMTHPRIRTLYPEFVKLCESSVSQLYHVEHWVGEPPAVGHIVERMSFRLKFGQARPACAIWKRILDVNKGSHYPVRMLTDITGPSYSLVVEMSYSSMMEYGPHQHYWMTNEKLREAYHEFMPLCESSERTLFTLAHQV